MDNFWCSEVMNPTILLTVIIGMSLVKSNKLSDPSCRCYLFDSKRQKSGIFKSPNYPSTYPADLDCILYQFLGNRTEIVKLTFWSFNMRQPEEHKCLDYVDLFTTIETTTSYLPRLDGQPKSTRQPADYRLCGPLDNLPQKEFYSVSSVLVLLLHSTSIPDSDVQLRYGGFVGQYSFESKDQYHSDGQLSPGTLCTYQFDYRSGSTSGQFFSPRYPSNYPAGIRCNYHFQAAEQERIVLTFREIELSATVTDSLSNTAERCFESDSSRGKIDMILVYESAKDTKQPLARICGRVKHVQIVSHGPKLRVDFFSQEDTFHGKGFHANYQFVHHTQVQPSPYMNASRMKVDQGERHGMTLVADAGFRSSMQKSLQQDDGRNSSSAWISPEMLIPEHDTTSPWSRIIYSKGSSVDNTGSLKSPGYPERYPASLTMEVSFVGKPNERVHLSFVMLELGSSKHCNEPHLGDRIEIYEGLTVHGSRLAEFCGSPNSVFDQFNTRLKEYETFAVTSLGRHLYLRFLSDSIPGEREYGFKLLYRFEQREATSDTFKPKLYTRGRKLITFKGRSSNAPSNSQSWTRKQFSWMWITAYFWLNQLMMSQYAQ